MPARLPDPKLRAARPAGRSRDSRSRVAGSHPSRKVASGNPRFPRNDTCDKGALNVVSAARTQQMNQYASGEEFQNGTGDLKKRTRLLNQRYFLAASVVAGGCSAKYWPISEVSCCIPARTFLSSASKTAVTVLLTKGS